MAALIFWGWGGNLIIVPELWKIVNGPCLWEVAPPPQHQQHTKLNFILQQQHWENINQEHDSSRAQPSALPPPAPFSALWAATPSIQLKSVMSDSNNSINADLHSGAGTCDMDFPFSHEQECRRQGYANRKWMMGLPGLHAGERRRCWGWRYGQLQWWTSAVINFQLFHDQFRFSRGWGRKTENFH